MLNTIEVIKSNLSTSVAGKLLVSEQEKENSMDVNLLFQPTQGMSLDTNEKVSANANACFKSDLKLDIN